jgi:hypothetical protein
MGFDAPTALIVGLVAPTGLTVGAVTPTGFSVGVATPTGLGDGFGFSVTIGGEALGVGDLLRVLSVRLDAVRSGRSKVTFFRDA